MIATDRKSARRRAEETHHLLDMKIIRDRVERRENSLAMRVILAALMQNSEKYADRVLSQLDEDDFRLPGIKLVFRWIKEQVQTQKSVDVADLYHRMREYVYTRYPTDIESDPDQLIWNAQDVLPGYLSVIDHIWAFDEIDDELFDSAMVTLLHFKQAREQRKKQTRS